MHLLPAPNVYSLHHEDRRLDSLSARIEKVIMNTQASQDISVDEIVGILERIKINVIYSNTDL